MHIFILHIIRTSISPFYVSCIGISPSLTLNMNQAYIGGKRQKRQYQQRTQSKTKWTENETTKEKREGC